VKIYHCDYDPKCEFEFPCNSGRVANEVMERHISTEHRGG